MKKYFIILLVIIFVYFFGLFGYDMAKPIDEVMAKKFEESIALAKTSSSSKVLVDLNSIKDINRQVVGEVMPDSKLYDMKIFGEKLHLYFAKTEIDEQRLRVTFLNRRLAEALMLLENGKASQAQQLVNKFAKGSEDLRLEIKKQEFLRINPGLATEIEKSISSQIELQKNLMLHISSTSQLYPIKTRLLDLELQMADTPEEKKLVMEKRAKEQVIQVISSTNMATSTRVTDWQIFENRVGYYAEKLILNADIGVQKITKTFNLVMASSTAMLNKIKQ